MRLLVLSILSILSIPTISYGIGLDSCRFEGKKIDGENVTLTWIYIRSEKISEQREGFGVRNSRIYGFCNMGEKGDHDYDLSCATSNGGKKTVSYGTKDGSTYFCNTGCEKDVVKEFVMVCDGD